MHRFLLILCVALGCWYTSHDSWLAILCFVLYGVLLHRNSDDLTAGWLLILILAPRSIWLFSDPMVLSDDVYRYAWDGYLVSQGISPYLATPHEWVAQGGMMPLQVSWLNSQDYFSVYPPLTQAIFGALWRINPTIEGFITSLRLAIVGMETLCLLGIAWLRHRGIALHSRNALLVLAHPLIFVGGAWGLHTETLLLPWLLALVFFPRRMLSIGTLAGALIKLYPILFVLSPGMRVRNKILVCLVFGLILLTFVGPAGLPKVLESLQLYQETFSFWSIPYLSLKEIILWLGVEDYEWWTGMVMYILAIGGGVVGMYWKGWITAAEGLAWMIGCLTLMSRTIHPWYLIPFLVVATGTRLQNVAYFWSTAALLSYGWYAEPSVSVIWTSACIPVVVSVLMIRPVVLTHSLRHRARNKAALVGPHVTGASVFDFGGGEGYLGPLVQEMGRTYAWGDPLASNRQDGDHPESKADTVLLIYVLHHVEDVEEVLQRAVDRARSRVIIVETIPSKAWQRHLYPWLDQLLFWVRFGVPSSTIRYRSVKAWTDALSSYGAVRVVHHIQQGFHHKAVFTLDLHSRT